MAWEFQRERLELSSSSFFWFKPQVSYASTEGNLFKPVWSLRQNSPSLQIFNTTAYPRDGRALKSQATCLCYWFVEEEEEEECFGLLNGANEGEKGREYWDWRQRKKERQENLCFKKYWEEYSSLDGEKYWAAKGYGDSYAKRLTKLEEYYFEINRNRLLVCIISFANVFNYK